jgi:hypothetical protein
MSVKKLPSVYKSVLFFARGPDDLLLKMRWSEHFKNYATYRIIAGHGIRLSMVIQTSPR